VSQYLTEGLDRARDGLNDAAALRERFSIGASVSRRVAAAAASAVCQLSCYSLHFSFMAAKHSSCQNCHCMG
jgi:hypothetical protein